MLWGVWVLPGTQKLIYSLSMMNTTTQNTVNTAAARRFVFIQDGDCGPSHLGYFASQEEAVAFAASGKAGEFSTEEVNSIQVEWD